MLAGRVKAKELKNRESRWIGFGGSDVENSKSEGDARIV
jgi:hypothetical protein